MKLVLFFLALLGLASVNALTTSTWTGTASALWTTSANWDSGVPSATTIAIISGTCSSNCVITIPSGTNATCFNLTVALGDTSTGLVIASGGALTTNLAVASDGWINVSGSLYGTLDTSSSGYVALLQGSYVSNLAASDSGQYYVSGTATIGSASLNSFDSFVIENGNLMVNGVFTLAAGEEEPIMGSGNMGANLTFGKSSYFYLSQDGALESVYVWQWGNAALTSAGSAFSAGGTFYVYEGVVYNLMPGATLYCFDIQYELDYYGSDYGNTTFNNWGTIVVMYQLGGDEYGNFAGLDTNEAVIVNGNFTFNNWGYINASNYSTTNTDSTYNTPAYYADSLVGGLHLNYLTFNQLNSTSWDGLLSFYYSDLYFSAASAGVNGVVNNVNSSLYAYSDSEYNGRSNVMGQAENNVHVLTGLTFNNFFFDDISVLVYTNGTTFNNTNFTNYATFNTTQSGVVVVNLTGSTGAEEITCDTYDWSGNPYSSLVVHNTRGSTFMAYSVYLLGQCMFVNNGTVTYLAGEYSDTIFYTPATTGVINLPGALFDYSGLVDGTNSDVTLTGTIYSDTASSDPAYLGTGTNWYNFGEFRIGDYLTLTDTGMHFWNEGTGLLTSLSTGSYDIATFSFNKLTLDGYLGIRYPDTTTTSLGTYFGSCSSSCSQEIFTWNTAAYPNTGSLLAPAGMFPGSVTQLSDFGSASLSTGTSQFLGDSSLGLCYNPSDSTTGYATVTPLLTSCTQAVGTGYIGATGHYGSTDFVLSSIPAYISGYTAASFAVGGPAGSGSTGASPPPASTGTTNPPPASTGTTNPPPASSTGSTPPPRTTTAGSTSASTTTGRAPTPATTTSSANVVFTSVFLMIISAFLLFL